MASVSKHLSVMTQVRRISRDLMRVVDECEKPVVATLHTQAALVAAEIKSVAPVDPESETPGLLKDSVRLEEGRRKGKKAYVVRILAGGIGWTLKQLKGGGTYDYARAVEFGTQDMPAYPFFFSVWRARRKGVRAVVRKAIREAVRRVFR